MITIKKIKNSYFIDLCQLGRCSFYLYYEINGEKTAELNIVLTEEPKTIYAFSEKRYIDHYIDKEGKKINPIDYDLEIKKLTKNASSCDDTEYGLIFDNLEDEYSFKKFTKKWEKCYLTTIEKQNIDFIIEEYPEDINEYIKSYRTIGKGIDKLLFCYNPNPREMIKNIANKYGFTDLSNDITNINSDCTKGNFYSLPTHSELKYLKINNTYVNHEYEKGMRMTGLYPGTKEECLKKYLEHCKFIEDKFIEQRKILDMEKNISKNEKENIYKTIKLITEKVSALKIKSSDDSYKINILNILEKLKDELLK